MKRKTTFLMLFGALLSLPLLSQNVHNEYFDGQVYFKINEIELAEYQTPNAIELDVNSFPYLNEEDIEYFGIFKIEQPFYRTSSKVLKSTFQIHFSEAAKVYEFMERYTYNEKVDFVEQVELHRLDYTPNDLGNVSGNGNQWHLHRISAQGAWDISKGNPNVIVAIVDDAVQVNHVDLSDNAYVNTGEIPNNGIDDDGNGYIDDYIGYDVATNSSNPNPPQASWSHGTHVAGISGAVTDNGTGVASIGFGIKILGIRATTSAQFVTAGYPGITYAADAGAHIINMSWGGTGTSATGQNVVNYAYSKGCILVAAAGNNGVSTRFYPAAYNNVIAVASSTTNDTKSNFSNFGTWIDITAPGSNIRSLEPFNRYSVKSGTSMASPLVAGLLGLMKSVNPMLTRDQLINCLYSSADNINQQNQGYIGQLGAGRINALQALQCVETLSNTPPQPSLISDFSEGVCPGSTVTFSASSTAGMIQSYAWVFTGGSPSTSTDPNPQITYNNFGTYDVELTLTNSFGSNTVTYPGRVVVSANAREIIFEEGFEGATITSSGWIVENPDNSITWENVNVGGSNNGSKAARVNLFAYPIRGQRDAIISPEIDFSLTSDVYLSFEHAHRRRVNTRRDSLIVSVISNYSTNPVETELMRLAENGSGIFATGNIINASFTPSGPSDWCFNSTTSATCNDYDMTPFDGQKIRLKFETFNDNGNNIYLDNVVLTGTCKQAPASISKVQVMATKLYPNPAKGMVILESQTTVETIELLDISGRTIKQFPVRNTSGQIQLGIQNVIPGYYFIRVNTNNTYETHKLVIQ